MDNFGLRLLFILSFTHLYALRQALGWNQRETAVYGTCNEGGDMDCIVIEPHVECTCHLASRSSIRSRIGRSYPVNRSRTRRCRPLSGTGSGYRRNKRITARREARKRRELEREGRPPASVPFPIKGILCANTTRDYLHEKAADGIGKRPVMWITLLLCKTGGTGTEDIP